MMFAAIHNSPSNLFLLCLLQWDELYRSKPDLDYEDPANVAAIKEAHENMGDFKLKSADDYIVPEKERVNADKKRAQIMQLKEQVYNL